MIRLRHLARVLQRTNRSTDEARLFECKDYAHHEAKNCSSSTSRATERKRSTCSTILVSSSKMATLALSKHIAAWSRARRRKLLHYRVERDSKVPCARRPAHRRTVYRRFHALRDRTVLPARPRVSPPKLGTLAFSNQTAASISSHANALPDGSVSRIARIRRATQP